MSDDGNGRKRAIETIAKLLATSGFTEEEMEARAGKVQELLVKYHLSLSDVGGSKAFPTIRDNDFLTDRAEWIKPLLSEVAKLFLCGYYFEAFPAKFMKHFGIDTSSNRKLFGGGHARLYLRHSFVGKETDIMVAKMFGEYLIGAMHDACREAERGEAPDKRGSFRHSFMNACAARLSYRLHLKREQAKNTGVVGTTNLPAVRSVYEQAQDAYQDWLNKSGVTLQSKKAVRVINHQGGARAGMQAGDRIGLDTQVSGETRKRLK